ncbi:MAG: hypothetical protein ACRBBN_20680 [Methyloligellaceae bacterium]
MSSIEWNEELKLSFLVEIQSKLAAYLKDDPETVLKLVKELSDDLSQLYEAAQTAIMLARTEQKQKGIGRNQISKLRELVILRRLDRSKNILSLNQIMGELLSNGFETNEAVVVSQLHRLSQNGIIERPDNGLYRLSNDALDYLEELNSTHGELLEQKIKEMGPIID